MVKAGGQEEVRVEGDGGEAGVYLGVVKVEAVPLSQSQDPGLGHHHPAAD